MLWRQSYPYSGCSELRCAVSAALSLLAAYVSFLFEGAASAEKAGVDGHCTNVGETIRLVNSSAVAI